MLRSATLDEPGGRWRLPNGKELVRHAERPLVQPTGHAAARAHRLATARCCSRPSTTARRYRCCSIRTADRTHSAVPQHNAFLTSQWFADQGFAIVVADGRGTPGRGSAFERSVRGDLASAALDDQIAALRGPPRSIPSSI